MAQCNECQYYNPIDDSKGDCFGHEVPATLDVEYCPAHSFTPRAASKAKAKAATKAKKGKH